MKLVIGTIAALVFWNLAANHRHLDACYDAGIAPSTCRAAHD